MRVSKNSQFRNSHDTKFQGIARSMHEILNSIASITQNQCDGNPVLRSQKQKDDQGDPQLGYVRPPSQTNKKKKKESGFRAFLSGEGQHYVASTSERCLLWLHPMSIACVECVA